MRSDLSFLEVALVRERPLLWPALVKRQKDESYSRGLGHRSFGSGLTGASCGGNPQFSTKVRCDVSLGKASAHDKSNHAQRALNYQRSGTVCALAWSVSERRIAIWLILPVVIRSSQRLSHACLSISNYTVKLRMAHYISYSLFDSTLLLG